MVWFGIIGLVWYGSFGLVWFGLVWLVWVAVVGLVWYDKFCLVWLYQVSIDISRFIVLPYPLCMLFSNYSGRSGSVIH